MRVRVSATLILPVTTDVDAESVEEAVRIAKTRDLGEDPTRDWCLDEAEFSTDALVLN